MPVKIENLTLYDKNSSKISGVSYSLILKEPITTDRSKINKCAYIFVPGFGVYENSKTLNNLLLRKSRIPFASHIPSHKICM